MINPHRYYTLYEIVKEGLIPWVKTVTQMSNLARTDKLTNNWLDATIVTAGDKVVQYKISGAKIIEYLANVESIKK